MNAPPLAGHAVQRGWRRRPTFAAPGDYEEYLRLLAQGLPRLDLSLISFCLMSNHVHLVVAPWQPEKIAALVGRVHARYADYLSSCRDLSGPVWRPRWSLTPLPFPALWSTVPYVELNPVRAGAAAHPGGYPWSSAAAHISGADPFAMLDLPLWQRYFGGQSWEEELRRRQRESRGFGRPPLYERGRGARLVMLSGRKGGGASIA